jgi:hypothetical protein
VAGAISDRARIRPGARTGVCTGRKKPEREGNTTDLEAGLSESRLELCR